MHDEEGGFFWVSPYHAVLGAGPAGGRTLPRGAV